MPEKEVYICSLHFNIEDYCFNNVVNKLELKPNTIPIKNKEVSEVISVFFI